MTNRLFLIGIVAGLAAALGLAGLLSLLSTESRAQMMGGSHMGMMGNNMMTGASQVSGQQVPWHWTNKASFGASGISNVENVQVTGISISGDRQVTVNLRYSGNGTSPNAVLIASTDSMGMGSSGGMMNGMGMMGGMHSGAMGMGAMGMMSGGMPMLGQGMVYSGEYPAWNNTQWQQWHNDMAQWHAQINNDQWQAMQAWHSQMMSNPAMTGPSMMSGQQMPMWGMWNGTATAMPIAWQQPLNGSTVLSSGWDSDTTVRVNLTGDGSVYDTNNVHVMVYPLTS